MNVVLSAKKIAERIPYPVGRLLAHVPFACRLGKTYEQTTREIKTFEELNGEFLKEAVYERFLNIFNHHIRHVNAYRDILGVRNQVWETPGNFDRISDIPPITKDLLKKIPLMERTLACNGMIKLNTGGTSGQPFEFFVDSKAFAREWAHMHTIWSRLDYQPWDLKLTFRGKNLAAHVFKYNCVHNELQLNSYCSVDRQIDAVEHWAKKIRYLHGYPSLIYRFVKRCRDYKPHVLQVLRSNLKGILFGSEYPLPLYRELIESELTNRTISWYGHSEMAVLAYEIKPYIYKPMHSYGYCEAVADDHGKFHLAGTSYYNTAAPFIRYDTGDLISPEFKDGILEKFTVEQGRIGEYITDKEGNQISLTALIFGRHHSAFGIVDYIQVRQVHPGQATLVVTVPDANINYDLANMFDLKNVDIDFKFNIVHEPVRTKIGKIPLLLR